ncbi:MAG TPA: transglycosylase SLT domain-containing protein [Mycobacteriales bacterium]|nr:transglycosylase SLT domain-containing protein [Mycobacteriales bacterium]
MRLPRLFALVLLVLGLVATSVSTAHASGCGIARAQSGRNPSFAQVSAAIDTAAQRRQVPPPLLKAIAWKESGWGQFWSDGRAKVSGDCGVGIMQLTGGSWDFTRLGRDYVYNIDAGAQALAAKMRQSSANVPPALGRDEPRALENWYRATYRYNGAGSRAEGYVDAVFRYIAAPPESIRPYSPPIRVSNPKSVIPGYRPTSGQGYVARLDGRWVSTAGSATGAVTRADLLPMFASLTPGRTLEGGQRSTVTYAVRNLGWSAWDPSQVTVMTWPAGRESALTDGTWRSPTTPAALARTVPSGAVARLSFPVRAALVPTSRSIGESFALAHAGQPISAVRASSSWTVHPAGRPTAAITAAPTYALEDGAEPGATVGLAASDPSPGAGLARVEISSRLDCDTCAWTAPVHVAPTTAAARVPLRSAGAHDVRVRAVDNAGNYGEWSAAQRVVVPRDDNVAEISYDDGWESVGTAGAWLGGVHTTNRVGASLETSVEGSRLAVVGPTGPNLAELEIWLDGVLAAVVTPRSDTLEQRRVIWETTAAPGRHHLRVRVGGSPLGDPATAPPAVIDAVAAG